MEIEAKFRALNHIKANAIEQIDWTPYDLGPRVVHILQDTLLDSPKRAITGARHALRIRNDSLHVYLTFKGPGDSTGALHRREEVEVLIDPAVVGDPQQWPETIRERVATLVDDLVLEPIVEIHNKRRTWEIRQGEHTVAELALDRGEIRAAGRTERLHEIELELKSAGTEDDLARLMERLQHALALAEEPRTKLARGLELLKAASRKKAPLVAMVPTADLAEAGRAVLRKHWLKLLKNEDGVREGDMEAVHDMRVSTRRLRAMLEVLTVVYDAKKVTSLRKGLKQLAASLGVVRDADVWIDAINTYTAGQAGVRTGMMPLMQMMTARRDAGRRDLLRALDAPRTRRLRANVEAFVSTPGTGVRNDGIALRVRDRAGSALWERYEAIRAFEPAMPVAPIETLHEVRIAGKYLRYTFELFDDALGADAKELRAELVEMQEHLGALHDADLAIPFVDALLTADTSNEALRAYRASLEQTAHEERRHSERSWEVLNSATFRQRLAAVIAAL